MLFRSLAFTGDLGNVNMPIVNDPSPRETTDYAITLIIIEECRKAHLKVHDFVIQNLVLHLALSINRLQQSISISTTELVDVPSETTAYRVAQEIIARVEVLQQINFPSQEVSF